MFDVAATHQGCPHKAMLQVGVIQFSTGINVHLPLDSYSADTFGETIDNMVSCAAVFAPLPPDALPSKASEEKHS